MKPLKILLCIIGISQIVLWILSLFAPHFFIETAMGLQAIPTDTAYPLGMLSARFFAYGIGIFYILKNISSSKFWILNMAFIQAFDFAVGLFYVVSGVVALSAAALPLFNAFVFCILLIVFTRNHSLFSQK